MNLPPLGKFRITEITHEVRRDGHYANTFAGIPDGTVNIPVPDAKLPLALPELATVKKNDDEKEQGRVKVSFDWQKKRENNQLDQGAEPQCGSKRRRIQKPRMGVCSRSR